MPASRPHGMLWRRRQVRMLSRRCEMLSPGRRQLRTESGVTGPTRRAVLAASAAALPLLLASCKGVQALGMPPPPPRDIAALRQAISAEHQLVRLYGAAIRH